MTCIAAVVHEFRVYMAGDSAISCGDDVTACSESKVRRYGNVVLGVAGGGRACQVALSARWPRYDGTDPYEFIVTELLPALRDESIEANGRSVLADLSLLIGVGGRLFRTKDATAWSDVRHDYAAIGSGEEYAIGSLAETAHLPPKVRLRHALTVASEHMSGVLPPWTFRTL